MNSRLIQAVCQQLAQAFESTNTSQREEYDSLHLIEYVENIILRTNVYILFYDPFTEEKNYSTEEHRKILAAIMSRDEESADRLMRDHLRHSHAVLEKPYERRNLLANINGLAKQNKAFSS